MIERVELTGFRVPYRQKMQFRSSSSDTGTYSLLRITTRDGAVGLAEATAFGGVAATQPEAYAAQIDALRPVLAGRDPFDQAQIAASLDAFGCANAVKAMIDVALWDLRGKLRGAPVWQLLGGPAPAPVAVTAIAFGETPDAMVDAAGAAAARGIRSVKLKVWQRSGADVEMVARARAVAGEGAYLYADANYSYTEDEARAILPALAAYGIAMLEDPCRVPEERLPALARALPMPVLVEIPIDSYAAAERYARNAGTGAITVHVGRTGITETLRIVALCEAAGLPVVVGTDLESPLGALARLHLCAAVPALRRVAPEVQFFENVADTVLPVALRVVDGAVTLPAGDGFGCASAELSVT